MISRIDLSAVLHKGNIYAVLLAGWPESDATPMPFQLPPIPQSYGAALFANYFSKICDMPVPPYFGDKPQAEASLKQVVSRHRDAGRSLHLCTIEIGALLEAVKPDSPTIDLFKFREDLLRILYSLVSPSGIYYEKGNNKVVIGFGTTAQGDCEFLAHHILLSIGDFFPGASLPDSLIGNFRSVQPEQIPSSPLALLD